MMHGKMLKLKVLQVVKRNNNIRKLIALFLLLYTSCGFAQNANNYKSIIIKIYLVKWDARYSLPRTIDNIRKNYIYYFETDGSDFDNLFQDSEDLAIFLANNPKLSEPVDIGASVCVEFWFGRKKTTLFFKNNGDFYYDGSWYEMNAGLYYKLFCHFSNVLIPEATLIKAKSKM